MISKEALDEAEKRYPRAGDVVILNSGGPNMLVCKNHDKSIECAWVDAEGELRTAFFTYGMVIKKRVIDIE